MHRREVVLLARPTDLEATVFRLARPAGVEPHERANRVAALVGRDIDAHERPRHLGEAEVAPQRVHGVGGALLDVECLDEQALEEVPGVLVRELDQLGVRAPLGDVPGHPWRELVQRPDILGDQRQQSARRAGLEWQVVAHQERAQDRSVHLVLGVLEEAVLPGDHPPAAHPQDDAAGVVAVAGEADRIRVAAANQLDGLGLLQLLQPADGIPQLRRPLEVQARARLLHPLPQALAHVHRLTLEEQQHVVDHPAVIFPRLVAHARRPAALDVVIETRPVGVVIRQGVVAGPDGEDAADDLEGIAKRIDVGVRAEVARAFEVHPPHDQHPGEGLPHGHRDAGVALVVPQ